MDPAPKLAGAAAPVITVTEIPRDRPRYCDARTNVAMDLPRIQQLGARQAAARMGSCKFRDAQVKTGQDQGASAG
jgi:hypothetical protein